MRQGLHVMVGGMYTSAEVANLRKMVAKIGGEVTSHAGLACDVHFKDAGGRIARILQTLLDAKIRIYSSQAYVPMKVGK